MSQDQKNLGEKFDIKKKQAHQKSKKHYKKIFDIADNERHGDPDSVTILQWWTRQNPTDHPVMTKTAQSCGGCYFTNDRSMEKIVDAILIDNTRWLSRKQG